MKKILIGLVTLFLFTMIVIGMLYGVLYPMKYKDIVLKYSSEYDVDPYLVYSVINVESRFKRDAVSNRDARGLMQIREITAKWANEHIDVGTLTEDDYYNPEINIQIGCWYLGKLSKMYDKNMKLIVAAYNAGTGNLAKWRYEEKDIENYEIPFKETEKYLRKVESNYKMYSLLY